MCMRVFSFSLFSTSLNQISYCYRWCWELHGRHIHQSQPGTSSGLALTPQSKRIIYIALNIYACLMKMTQTSPRTDSPLCSPKNTSLNFLRGFPKSPPADMVADKGLNLDYFICSYSSASLSPL